MLLSVRPSIGGKGLRVIMNTKPLPNRRECITARTESFHFSISFHPETGHPVEIFVGGRGKSGSQLDEELVELSAEASKIMQGRE